jgi:hypothetical protein
LTPTEQPTRTDLYAGVVRLIVTGVTITLHFQADVLELRARDYTEIEVDEGGVVS